MNITRTGNAIFGEVIGMSAETVRRYRAGEREPDAKIMALIFEKTEGQVSPNDWVGVGPRSNGAEVATS